MFDTNQSLMYSTASYQVYMFAPYISARRYIRSHAVEYITHYLHTPCPRLRTPYTLLVLGSPNDIDELDMDAAVADVGCENAHTIPCRRIHQTF